MREKNLRSEERVVGQTTGEFLASFGGKNTEAGV